MSHSTSGATTYKFLYSERRVLRFRLSNVNVHAVNAIRRTLLTDIPVDVMRDCDILVNTGRLTNEIIKHRLSLIPVHSKDVSLADVEVEVNVQAEDTMRLVTTEDFRLRRNKELLPTTLSQQVFPCNEQTRHFLEFARLRPKLGDTIPGEQLHLVARLSIATARENSAFNVVSTCAYQNTPDEAAGAAAWEKELAVLQKQQASAAEIAGRKKDFLFLDARRYVVPDSFDFVLETIGLYENEELVQKACRVLQERLLALYDGVRDYRIFVRRSDKVSMENCFDVTLVQEDYTLGNLLAHLLLETFYEDKTGPRMSFCGFKKEHPHDDDSTLRMAFEEAVDEARVRECLAQVCNQAHTLFEKIERFFQK
jgi:DNA-directed RNA polymerase II subunit RPB3